MKVLFAVLGILSLCQEGVAQRTLTLAECVDIAVLRSLDVESADLNMRTAEIGLKQARHNRYPSLNLTSDISWNYGRTIDPTTNIFDNQSSFYQTLRLNFSMPLYQGMTIHNAVRRAEFDNLSVLHRKEGIKDNIALEVVQSYLNAQLAEEAVALAEIQVDLTKNQMDRIDRLIAVGSVPANDRLELEAQLARDEQQSVDAINHHEIALLNLKQILRMDPSVDVVLEKIDPDLIALDESSLEQPSEAVYQRALTTQPTILADSMDMKVALLDKKISQGRLLPTLGLGGSIASNYSSLAQQVVDQRTVFNDIPVMIGGMETVVGFPSTEFTSENTPYFDQWNNNLGYGLGVSLQVPIYNNYSARLNVEQAEVNTRQIALRNENNRQTLRSTVQNAIAQAKAAGTSMEAAEKSVESQRSVMENLEKKLEAGQASNFDFITAKNNLLMAENSLLQSKFDYILKLKVVDYYLGKPLAINNQ